MRVVRNEEKGGMLIENVIVTKERKIPRKDIRSKAERN
tara:strand:+ start:166 stop:279 length:114 start_codon:yes stop_codon:yes gene_type:complete